MKQYLIILLICIAGLGLTWVLLPKDKEIALMHMKDKDFEVALDQFEGNREALPDAATAGTMAQLYLQNGDVDKAIAVLEDYIQYRPNDVEARIRLGQYYQYAQRPEDYLRNLEVLSRIDTEKTYLKELSRIYNYNADYQKQIDVLAKLADGGQEGSDQLLQLVQLLASMDQKADALTYMILFKERYPASMGVDETQLLFSLYVDNARDADAIALAKEWSASTTNVSALAYYAAAVSSLGESQTAIDILEPHLGRSGDHPEILIAYISLHRATGRNSEAYEVLEKFHDEQLLPIELLPTYLELAVAFNEREKVFELAEEIELDKLNRALILNMVDLGFDPQYSGLRQLLAMKLSEEYMKAHPSVHAGLLLSFGEQSKARAVLATTKKEQFETIERAYLSVFHARAKMKPEALDYVRGLDHTDRAINAVMPRIANAYILADAAKEGMAFAEAVREDRKKTDAKEDTSVVVGWLLLAAANGRQDEVMAMLDAMPSIESGRVTLDLFYVASQSHQHVLMVALAERYHKQFPKDDIGFTNLLQAYTATGRAGKTIELLEARHSAEELRHHDVYTNAIAQLVLKGKKDDPAYAPARVKFVEMLTADAKDSKKSEGDRKVAIDRLLALGEYDIALPMVKDMAFANPRLHGPLYVNYTLKARRTNDTMQFIEFALKNPNVPEADKAGYVNMLVERGEASRALPYLEKLAIQKGGNWLFAYEDALKKKGIQKDLVPLYKQRAAVAGIGDAEKRLLAYKLADAGEVNDALPLFNQLASVVPASNPDSPDVRQLVYLQAKDAPESTAQLLLKNATEAPDAASRLGWVKHLQTISRYDLITQVAESRNLAEESADMLDIYVQALQQQKQQSKLSTVLTQQMQQPQSPERMAYFANAALSIGELELARKGFETVIGTDAFAPYMLKELGNITFFQGDFDASKEYYNRYLQETSDEAGQGDYVDPDYIVHLRLGIIYLRNKEDALARRHLVRSLELIETAAEKDRNIWLAEAKARYLLGRDAEAIDIYKFLLEKNPNDFEVVGDYAEVLIKQKQYAAAEELLAGLNPDAVENQPVPLLGSYEQGGSQVSDQHLRIELLKAEIMLGKGDYTQALAKYKALEIEYPENPYPLIGQASINNYQGFWENALQKLDKAQTIEPDNRDVARVRKRIFDLKRTQLTAGIEYRSTNDIESGPVSVLRGHKLLDNYDKVGFNYEHFFYEVENAVRMNGVIGDYRSNAFLAELYYHHNLANNHRVEASVHGSRSGAGGSLAYVLPGVTGGPLKFFGEYNKPFWFLGQGMVNDSARDRAGFIQQLLLSNQWFGNIGATVNRYTYDGNEEVAKSIGVNGSLGYRFAQFTQPDVSIIYGFDGDYLFDEDVSRTVGGLTFQPFPIQKREIHTLALNLRDDTMEDFWWELYGGYAYDRFGGRGVIAGGELNYLFTERLLGTLRGQSIINNNVTGNRYNHAGAYLTVRF